MICRRDTYGVVHWAATPAPYTYRLADDRTGARCDFMNPTSGDLNTVPQDGPTCLWCLLGIER